MVESGSSNAESVAASAEAPAGSTVMRRLLAAVAALCLAAIGIGMLFFIASRNNAGQRDFIEYWAAGQQLVHGGDPYDGAAILPLQQAAGLMRATPQVSFSPPFTLFLALPLGFVGSNVGFILWLLLIVTSLVISVRLLWVMHGRPDDRLHLLGYCFAPVMICLMAGQLGIFFLLGMTLFLYLHKTRPLLAGVALLPCALKPHLFMPFALALLLWVVSRKAYGILAGFFGALLSSSLITMCFDPRVWSQYSAMMKTSQVLDSWVPTLSCTLRFLVDKQAVWIQFAPEAAACAWAVWYFWTRRASWDWMDQGMLVLLVSAMCAPYAWFTDEAMLLPAVLGGVYRAETTGRSLVPFGVVAGLAVFEMMLNVPLSSTLYLWSTPAWLAWYLYATSSKRRVAESVSTA
jgi:hypothetical protein